MADMRIQRYTPDTCPNPATKDVCILEEQWDADLDPASRVHTLVNVVQRCSAHAAAATDQDVYEDVKDENYRKNAAINIARTHYAATLAPEALEALAKTVEWSFDGSRVLLLGIPGVVVNDRSSIQSNCNVQFGPGKVIIS